MERLPCKEWHDFPIVKTEWNACHRKYSGTNENSFILSCPIRQFLLYWFHSSIWFLTKWTLNVSNFKLYKHLNEIFFQEFVINCKHLAQLYKRQLFKKKTS